MYLSIIIPAYNEEKRIGDTLSRIYDYLALKDFSYEIIVVDDGSRDNTVAQVEKSALAQKGMARVVRNSANRGKGFSVRQGLITSTGEYVLFSDADLSTPIEEFDKLFAYIQKDYDIVIGSRSSTDSDVRIHQPWHRERMGKIFNFFVRAVLAENFRDTQCGFKLFKGASARQIAARLKLDGFCFDVEMLYLAKILHYKVKEAGVIWNNSAQSKVKIMGSSLNMFTDLLRIKALHKCDS